MVALTLLKYLLSYVTHDGFISLHYFIFCVFDGVVMPDAAELDPCDEESKTTIITESSIHGMFITIKLLNIKKLNTAESLTAVSVSIETD
jgi:hypothetical protein